MSNSCIMSWSKNLQQIVRNNVSSNYVLKGSSTTGILNSTKSSILGLLQLHGGGFDGDGNPQLSKHPEAMLESRRFKHSARKEPELDRDFLARLWVLDKEMEKAIAKRRMAYFRGRNFRKYHGSGMHVFEQPPLSQSTTGYLAPTSPEEVNIFHVSF